VRFITAIAIGLLAIGMLCNVIFYSAFGNGGHSLFYASIGLFFDIAKIGFIGVLAYLMRDADRHYLPILICAFFFLSLSVISLLASIGFLSQINEEYEAARLKDSAIYAEHETAVQKTQAKLDSLSDYAPWSDTGAIRAEIESLRQQNQTVFQTAAKNSAGQHAGRTVGEMTANCTKTNWYFNRYCGDVTDNKASIQRLQARLDNHQRFSIRISGS
jgi:hypothetical protein